MEYQGQTVQSSPKAAGGFGPLRVNNRNVILVPFNKPEAEFDLLIGDWYSYDYKITLDSLDVHIGQSYSVLVTANQLDTMAYFMVANPTQSNSSIIGVGVLHYANSTTPAFGPLPVGPNPMDREFSVNQARSISLAERFDPRTISWESVPSMKTSRGGHSVAAFNEKIYAFGGFDGTRNVWRGRGIGSSLWLLDRW
ncbi:hypothetical protein IFM89_010239 [Coptis chinensis]|uniref:Plastocyanin-like domain-containing protein n=1 Tax=Coptis chinensis TaxID=261450 RepID=A0A835M527_9MAGN|nr:hypothetical protein IFM89_010239 [Coptis chinensis]